MCVTVLGRTERTQLMAVASWLWWTKMSSCCQRKISEKISKHEKITAESHQGGYFEISEITEAEHRRQSQCNRSWSRTLCLPRDSFHTSTILGESWKTSLNKGIVTVQDGRASSQRREILSKWMTLYVLEETEKTEVLWKSQVVEFLFMFEDCLGMLGLVRGCNYPCVPPPPSTWARIIGTLSLGRFGIGVLTMCVSHSRPYSITQYWLILIPEL